MKIIIVVIYMILTVSGLILMKLGGNPGTIAIKDGNMSLGISLISGLGFICYICSFLLYTRIITMFDLSYIFPICTGVIQIAVFTASAIVFKEQVTWQSIAGIGAILLGVTLMNIKK